MSPTLADVPEEILERILALVLVQSPEFSPRPSWHPYTTASSSSSSSTSSGHPTVISPLLVCRTWLRIATPIHYRHPVLRTPRHAELLLRALRHSPAALAPCVRSLHLHATSPALRELVPLCPNLDTLDITVDNADVPLANLGPAGRMPPVAVQQGQGPGRDRRVVEFCEAFGRTRAIRHLVVRKNAYLTQPNATYVFEQLAKAIARWPKLETVNVAFRLSPSPAASALTQALAAAPRLHTLYTQLPAVWNTTLLDIAQNPSLARIVLSPAPEHAGAHLFLAEAKRHPRLVDLICAGAAPPSPRPSHRGAAPPVATEVSFSLAGSARARAASAVVAAGHGPMPVPTWGYERDVPPPMCRPPASSRRPSVHHAYAQGQQQAYAYSQGQAQGQGQYYPAPQQHAGYPQVYAPGANAGQPQMQQYAYPAHQGASPAPRMALPIPVGGEQAQRRSAGSRRMTAS